MHIEGEGGGKCRALITAAAAQTPSLHVRNSSRPGGGVPVQPCGGISRPLSAREKAHFFYSEFASAEEESAHVKRVSLKGANEFSTATRDTIWRPNFPGSHVNQVNVSKMCLPACKKM